MKIKVLHFNLTKQPTSITKASWQFTFSMHIQLDLTTVSIQLLPTKKSQLWDTEIKRYTRLHFQVVKFNGLNTYLSTVCRTYRWSYRTVLCSILLGTDSDVKASIRSWYPHFTLTVILYVQPILTSEGDHLAILLPAVPNGLAFKNIRVPQILATTEYRLTASSLWTDSPTGFSVPIHLF